MPPTKRPPEELFTEMLVQANLNVAQRIELEWLLENSPDYGENNGSLPTNKAVFLRHLIHCEFLRQQKKAKE